MNKKMDKKGELKHINRAIFFHKLKTGWYVIRNRYGYYDYMLNVWLLVNFVFLVPVFLLIVLPWYIFIVILDIDFVIFLLPILGSIGVALGIIFVLLMMNYVWTNEWYQ